MEMNQSVFTCSNCQNQFNQKDRQPIMICKKQHSVCQICVKQLSQKKIQTKCITYPCKQQFKILGKNRMILQFIINKEDLLEWVKQRDKKLKKEKKSKEYKKDIQIIDNDYFGSAKINITLYRFPGIENYIEINRDSYLKINQQNSWHTVKSNQYICEYQIRTVSIKVINSAQNSIIIGISNKMDSFYKASIPSQSLAFHLNNGHIYDKDNNSIDNSFKWRTGGTPVAKDSNPTIKMIINMLDKVIKWKIGGLTFAESKIPQILHKSPNNQSNKIYPYISLYHKGDLIVFNIDK